MSHLRFFASLLLAGSLFTTAAALQAEGVRQAWVKTPDAETAAFSPAVAVDAEGNVIATGASAGATPSDPRQIYTAKYAVADGALLWEHRTPAPAGSQGSGAKVAVDGAGDVLVVGGFTTNQNPNAASLFLAKYAAADGAPIWEQTYSEDLADFRAVLGFTLDSQGNPIVTGSSIQNGFFGELYTAKYSAADGTLVWKIRYHFPGGSAATGNAVVVDGADNVVVTGTSATAPNAFDLYTAKYAAADGALIWEARSNVAGSRTNGSFAAAIDPAGNIAVAGITSFAGPGGPIFRYYTVKYDGTSGVPMWEQIHAGSATSNPESRARAVGMDAEGNVFVTGNSLNTDTRFDYYTVKYASADGAILWENNFNGPAGWNDYGADLAVDAAGDVFVTGQSGNGDDFDAYTAKYAGADGALLWERRYDGPPTAPPRDQFYTPALGALALTPDGGVVITGVRVANSEPAAMIKYTPVADPVFTAVASIGDPVPGAGVDLRIQAGAVWTGFGSPAINNAHQIAYLGKWKAPATLTPAKLGPQSGIGIFVDGTLVAAKYDHIPGSGEVGYKGLKDPVLDDAGHVAFIASVAGRDVFSGNDTVVVSNARTGSLETLAREGDSAPGTPGALFKTFGSVSIKGPLGGTTIFTAALLQNGGGLSDNDTGVWWQLPDSASPRKLVREGDPGFAPGEKIKSCAVLKPIGGSLGQGRGQLDGSTALVQLTMTNTRQSVALAEPETLTEIAGTGDALAGSTLPLATWKKLNLPSSSDDGAELSLLGMLNPKVGGVQGASVRGIFLSHDHGTTWEPVARIRDEAPGFSRPYQFSVLHDPVQSSTGAGIAFAAAVNNIVGKNAVWWQPEGAALAIIAHETSQPVGAPAGARLKTFLSLALPGGDTGPLFTARLEKGRGQLPGPGGITSADDTALYGVDSFQNVRELLRKNQPLLGKTVKTFSVLKAVAGSAGTTRSFNAHGQVAVLVSFTDHSSAIVKIDLP